MTSVLVLDEAVPGRQPLETILRPGGYEVVQADSGARALEIVRAWQPDLVIADILMPTMDGYQLIRELRRDPATANIPVILYIGPCLIEEVRELAGAFGVSHILLKPPEPDEVLRMVSDALSQPHDLTPRFPSEDFQLQQLHMLTTKLLQKTEEIRETAILAGCLQRASGIAIHAATHELALEAAAGQQLAHLSTRESEVLGLIVEGASNGEIAARLVIAPSTVQSHVKRILHKLGVKNRTEAAVRYVRG